MDHLNFDGFLDEDDEHEHDRQSGVHEQAQNIAFDAMDARGRRRRKLARQALVLWPDCCDALCILAEDEPDLDTAIELFRNAVAAGERALGPQVFKEDVGHFWGLLETRPYMRAKLNLAQVLCLVDAREEAVDTYNELLRLNPNDNQGVRTFLGPALLELGRYDEATALLTAYRDTHSAMWHFTWALLSFLKDSDGSLARRRLTAAFKQNPYVPDLMLGRQPLASTPPPYFQPGEVTEAEACVSHVLPTWQASEGAMAWLAERWDRIGT